MNMNWTQIFEQLQNNKRVARLSQPEGSYVYRRRIRAGSFVLKYVYGEMEMRYAPDYDDLIATDWFVTK